MKGIKGTESLDLSENNNGQDCGKILKAKKHDIIMKGIKGSESLDLSENNNGQDCGKVLKAKKHDTVMKGIKGSESLTPPENINDKKETSSIKPKRSRPDRALKLAQRKTHQETVVKCCLKKLLIGDSKIDAEIPIKDRVLAYSKRMHLASVNINYMLQEVFDGVETQNLHTVQVPPIFGQTFIRQMMLGTKKAIQPIPQVVQFYSTHPNLLNMLDEQGRHFSDKNMYSSGAKKYMTNLKNHYITNLSKWIKKWVYSPSVKSIINPESTIIYKSVTKTLLYHLHNWQLPPNSDIILNSLPTEILDDIQIQKSILGTNPLDTEWLDDEESLEKMVKYAVFINRFKEERGEGKFFNLAPICGIRNHFMTIDTLTLYGIMRDMYFVDCTEQVFIQMSQEHWSSFLNIKKISGRGMVFTQTIETDGTSVCVHFKRPKNATSEKNNDLVTLGLNDVAVGIDPGRSNILYCVWKDGRIYKCIVLSRMQYYKESGIISANKRIAKWQSESTIKEALKTLSHSSSKGANLHIFEEYVAAMISTYSVMWSEYTKRRWSDQRLRLYGGKKRVFANFLNNLQKAVGKDKNVILSYGSAKFAPGGKGEISVPTTRAFKECSNRFETHVTDEFRTTVVDHKTLTLMKGVGKKGTGNRVRGLLWCSSTIQSKCKFVNRDQNAAINILNCMIQERPAIMKRSLDNTPVNKEIVRWIKK